MKKNKQLKFIPTWKIKEILDHPYTQGIDGADYGPVKEELEQILWERQSKETINTDNYFSIEEGE